ncbi:group II intron maturase-specific domain-containing protein [Thermodesulfobacteriota bacterium]
MDLWFERRVKPSCRGEGLLIRFADDFVCAVQNRSEAADFFEDLGARLGKFGLEPASDKTHLIRFCRADLMGSGKFDFLGFEFYWACTRSGRPGVKRRTSAKKLRAALRTFTDWIKRGRGVRVGNLMKTLIAKYQGYCNYYGVIGNCESLAQFFYQTKRLLFKWLNRRSQRRSYSWQVSKLSPPPSGSKALNSALRRCSSFGWYADPGEGRSFV